MNKIKMVPSLKGLVLWWEGQPMTEPINNTDANCDKGPKAPGDVSHTLDKRVRQSLPRKENVCLELDDREDSGLRMPGRGRPSTHTSR